MATVDDQHVKPSLADDPSFLLQLNDLDAGLGPKPTLPARPPTAGTGKASRPRVPPPAPQHAAPPSADLEAVPARPFPGSALVANPVQDYSAAPDRPEGRRPLLDLFPPAPVEFAAPASLPGTAVGPRLQPSRRATRPEPVPSPAETSTYETFYGMAEPPFDLSTDPKYLYSSASHERVAQRLLTAIRRHDGFVLITGLPGVGKTTACRSVIEQLDRRTLTSLLTDLSGSIEDLLQRVLVDFGVVSREDLSRVPATRQALIDTLQSFLASLAAVQATALVFLDEAQDIPVDVLKELPLLAGPDEALSPLQLVLVGQPGLLSLLRRRALRDLARSLRVRCAIEPLSADEVSGYISHRLSVAGGSPRLEFDDAAILLLHQLSGGLPRTINVVCEQALRLGCRRSASVIDAVLVQTAADELGVVPPTSRWQAAVRSVALGLALFAMVLVGAAGSLWVFRAQAARTVFQWTGVPQAPASPIRHLPTQLTPIPAPADPAPAAVRSR